MNSTPQSSPHAKIEVYLQLGLSRRWRWHIAEGSCLLLLGVASLLAASGGSPVVSGAILLLAGAATLLSVWRAEQYPGFALSLTLALIAFAAGFHLLGNPPDATLNRIFAAYFACRGIVTVMLAAAHRRQFFKEWEWFAVSGVTSLILAMMILSGLPGPYTWMLGMLLGVDLIFDGSALFALVLASSDVREAAPAPAFDGLQPVSLSSGSVCEESVHV